MRSLLGVLLLIAAEAWAQNTQVTGNLISGNWSGGITSGSVTGGGYSGGNQPAHNPSTNPLYFGYNQGTMAQAIAINNALSGSGVKVSGYDYSWQYYNQDYARGTLAARLALTNASGTELESFNYTLGATTNGWTQHSGTQNFGQQYGLSSVGNLTISFTGKDDRWWAGYYGPQVKDVSVGLRYTVDPCVADPQSSPSCPGYKTYYNLSDDGYARVNLPFSFPFYGRTFTTSYFFSNGVVGFLTPTIDWCCDGQNITKTTNSAWNFALMPLWADLIGDNQSKFYTQSDNTYMKYTWDNTKEWGTNNRNTFSAEIRPSGAIAFNYSAINITNHNVTVGISGDLSQGQYSYPIQT